MKNICFAFSGLKLLVVTTCENATGVILNVDGGRTLKSVYAFAINNPGEILV
jgi:hypothetical protein